MKNSLSKRLLSLLLCLAMFLSLAPAAFAAPQEKRLVRDDESVVTVTLGDEPEEEPGEDPEEDPEEPPFWGDGDELNSNEPPSGRFNPYFKIADDMVGGTVTDNQNIYTNTSALGKQVTAGLTVTLYPHPEAGYEFRSWSVVCVQDEQYYYDVDDHGDWGEFLVGGPYNNRYTFEIRAEFEYIDSGYPIDCYSVDASGLGSSISVDKTDAKVGETVSILVDRKPGTVFDSAPYAFFNTNESYPYSGGYSIPLTKESDSLYTFVVPEDITRYIKQTDQTIYVRAEFALGEYAVTVDSVSDPEGTGNTVSADKAGAGLGDEVTVSVMMRYATAYGPEGLQVFWLDEEGRERPVELTLSGSSVSPYSSSGETTYTYTFAMPEHDVHITADFVKIGHRISIAPVDVSGQMLRGRFFQGKTNLSVSPNEQRAAAGDTITAELHVDHEENMGSYGVKSAWITWEENGAAQRRELENLRYDEHLHFYGDFIMPDADVVLHAELERSWWVVTEKYADFSLDPDKWEAFVGETVTVTANLIDEGSETFEGWTWIITNTSENEKDIPVSFTYPTGDARTVSFVMPAGVVSVELHSPYEYISRWWTGSEVKSVTLQPTDFKLISSLQDNENLTLTSGVWILSQSRSFSNRLTVSGDVHLVLCDGATLTCGKGVELAPGNSLSIYGQEEDTGKLICTGPENHAGIGGGNNTGSGSFTIHGGTVTANGGDYAAGVGTGDEASPDSCGSFTMLGGSLTAKGGTDGAGVGGGNEVKGGTVTVYDGSLTVKGGDYAAGIGGGDEKDGGSVTIYNGTVKTTGGPDGAGIGGGEGGSQGGIVTIYDGTVTTTGGTNGAGIGGGGRGYSGNAGDGGTVIIYNGTVNVTAGLYAAGIGGGSARLTFTHAGNGGNVSISGGTITIDTGGQSGAGIGGGAGAANFGYAGNGGNVSISGGKLTINMFATRSAGIGGGGCDYECGTSGSVNISGGEISISISSGYIGELYVESQGAGIGGAAEMDQGGDIRITGGVIMIDNKGYGAGIGGGASEAKPSEAGNGGNVYINNAFVIATSQAGAGIGGGGSLKGGGGGGDGGNVTIDGGAVYAISSNKGAGIGGGNDGNGGTLTVNGGYVMATGGYLDYNYIRDHGLWSDDSTGLETEDQGWTNLAYNLLMHFITSGEFAGAGIGGGDDGDGGTVIINGGTVIALSGMNSARAFGRGDGGDGDGSVKVYDQAKVTYGTVDGKEPTILGVAYTADRESTCMSYAYARVEICDHPNAVYTCLSDTEHRYSCPNCSAKQITEAHAFDDENDHDCKLCGYERVIVTLLPGEGSGNAIKAYVTKREQYTLPECGFTGPSGRAFSGWFGSVNGGEEATYPAGSSFRLTQDLTLTALWNDPYRLWVNGVRVTSDNQSDVLGGGMAVYDPETCTLTLNGPVFTDTHEGALIYADGLNLTLAGSGVLTMDEAFDTGVRVVSGSLTIGGDISVAGAGTNGLDADEDVILQSGVIAAQGGSYGIRAGRSIYVRRDIDRVTADGSRALSYQEIDVDPGVTVVERTSANRLPPEDEWDLENANHVVFDQGVVVSFVLNGGEMEGETGTVQHNIAEGMTVAEPDPAPTREGYTFGGWYTDEGLTLAYDFETELDEDISLYAKWIRAYSVEIRWEKGDELEEEPESVKAVLQRGRDGQWTTVQELTLTAEDEWKGNFDYVPDAEARDDDEFRVRELEYNGNVVLDPADGSEASNQATAILQVGGEQKGYVVSYKRIEDSTLIINSSTKQYSVELSWDIDLGDQDRPGDIDVVLQRQENFFSWKSVELITLSPANGWSGEFQPVPIGFVDEAFGDREFVFYKYRVRELRPQTEQEQQQEYESEEERLAAADKRVVHDKFDLDKDIIAGLVKAADPDNLWTFDYTVKWVTGQATKIAIPPPTFTAKIEAYTDMIGKEIPEHESKYHVKYAENSATNKMSITDTAVLDVSVYKRWINFDDKEIPESVYLMLMSKVDDEYAAYVGVEEYNIYTPVLTVVYGSQLNIMTVPGVKDEVKSGIEGLLGKGFGSTVLMTVLEQVVVPFTNTHIALAEAKGEGHNYLTKWRVTFGVKKYGGFGVPMEFAGVELITGIMEMAIDGVVKALGIPKVECPVMYHPIYKCWSIKGYALNIFKDYELTCNVVNLKFDGDDPPSVISGTKTWVNDTEDQRPEQILIHVYAKGEDGSRKDITGSPVTVTAADNWEWSLEIPLNDIAVVKEDGENSSVSYKELEVEEEIPDGYEASYDGYDITNTYTGKKMVEGHKSWQDENDKDGLRPESITIRLYADDEEVDSRIVTASDDWKWSFKDLPLAKDGQEIEYSIREDPVEGYESEISGYNVTNTHTPEEDETEKIEVSGHKIWNDSDNAGETRPDSITIHLLADGTEIDARTVSEMGSWSWSFRDLPRYRADGVTEIVYSIVEDPVEGYETGYSGYNVTNTLEPGPEKLRITGQKTWVDDGNTGRTRPESITIRLLADGEEIDSRSVTETDDWSWDFPNLPKYGDDGETEIVYRITEDPVEGYEPAYDGYNVSNVLRPEPEKIMVEGTKTWVDEDDAAKKRPESITIKLFADNEEKESRTVTEAEDWSWSFPELPKYKEDRETEIVYRIEEEPVDGYETSYDGYNVTNTLKPETEKITVEGAKTWEDEDDAAKKRPDSITIKLFADDEEKESKTVTEAEDWSWSFTELPKYKEDGETEIVYRIEEEPVEGYETAYDGYNVTNTLQPEPEKIQIRGEKTWDDLNDADGLRPESITIRLYADGEELEAKTVTEAERWSWDFGERNKYRDDGETEIVYSITEDPVEGYVTEIEGFNVTNTIVSRVYGYNVNLKGRIGLNVYLFIPQRVLQDGGLTVTLNGDRYPVAEARTRQAEGLTIYQFPVDKAAKEMNDLVTVRLFAGDGSPETLLWRNEDVTDTGWSYCIQTYIDRSIEDDVEPLLLEVVRTMNDYGSLAQAYFHYNEANRAPVLGNPGAVTESDLQPYEAKLTPGKATGVSYAGSRLVLKSGTVIRHYFSIDEGSVEDYSFKLGKKTVTPVETEDGWMIEIPDVYARYLDNMYTVTVSSSEGRVLTLKYSALSYAYKVVQNNEDPALVELVKAMYLYNRAAKAYFS